MSTVLNHPGLAHAHALVAAGKINDSAWSFSAEDGNKLLGDGGDDWANYGQWFLALHTDQTEKTKGYYGYPFGKDGAVYRGALAAIASRASAAGADDVSKAASALIATIDAKKAGLVQVMKRAPLLRAYSVLTIKSIDDEQRVFEGIATTPATDRMDDIVEPMGAQYKLPIPMLWQHGYGSIQDPVGQIFYAKPTEQGILVRGQMQRPGPDYPQPLTDDLNKAWVLVRDKLVRGLSIGFNPIESIDIDGSWGKRYTKWEWLELSAVTIAANQEANIQTVKSIAAAQREAARGRVVKLDRPIFPKPGVVRL